MKDFNETNFNNLEDNQEPKPMDSKMNEQEVELNVSAAAAEDINSPSEAQAQIEINKTESEQSEDSVYNTSKMDPAYMKETFKPLKINLNAEQQSVGHDSNSNAEARTSEPTGESHTYQAQTSQSDSSSHSFNGVPYNEHIKKAKRKKGDKNKTAKRWIAGLTGAAVLNLAILGGAFGLGVSFGKQSDSIDSRASLVDSINQDSSSGSSGSGSSSGSGMETAASTEGELDTTEIAQKVGPAVVGIRSAIQGQMSIFGGVQTSTAEGSGIILSEDGYIVTNNHVIEGASAVSVILNTGSEFTATVIGADSESDIAVIKIEPTEELTVATLGDSDSVVVGERAVAIGNPMGLEFFGSVTQGIISAVNRTIDVDNRTMNVIQTDAAINSGNSGGALVNARGEVIGINTVKVSTTGVEGMGFAIPISQARPIISDLLEYGYVTGRPVIGISTRDVTEYMATQYNWPQGAQVMAVTSENAQNAGLQQGDIITAVDGNTITSGSDLTEYKDTKSPGDEIELQVYKYATGTTETVRVVLSEQIPD